MIGRPAGLGIFPSKLTVCIANRPPQAQYQSLKKTQPLAPGELSNIVSNSSNHWRKVFNVYAKLVFALQAQEPGWTANHHTSWQDFRERELLQAHAFQSLLFTAPPQNHEGLVVIAGKTWAETVVPESELHWLDAHFAVHPLRPWIVSPYFDYRQLSNARIAQLIDLIMVRSGKAAAQ